MLRFLQGRLTQRAGVALPQNDYSSMPVSSPQSHILGVIPGHFFLFVALFMFFVDDNESQAGKGANTAERAPTTISASPLRIRRHSSKRSPALKALVEHLPLYRQT